MGAIGVFIVISSLGLPNIITGIALIIIYGFFLHSVITSALDKKKEIEEHPLIDPMIGEVIHPAPVNQLRASLGSTLLGGESVDKK